MPSCDFFGGSRYCQCTECVQPEICTECRTRKTVHHLGRSYIVDRKGVGYYSSTSYCDVCYNEKKLVEVVKK